MIHLKQVTAQSHLLFKQVKYIYQHPLHYTYVLHKVDGLLHLYDQGTMEVVGKTKVVVLDQMKLFAFTNDFNLFYGVREGKFLIFQLTTTGLLLHVVVQNNHQTKPYLEAHCLSYYAKKNTLICVTSHTFYFVQPNKNPYKFIPSPLRSAQGSFYPQKVAQLSPLMWLVGYKNYIYFLQIGQALDGGYKIHDRIEVGNIVKLTSQNNPKKQFAYLINDQNQVLLIKIYLKVKKIKVCFKFYKQNYLPLYLTLLRPGINTSTTDRFKNTIFLSIYCQQLNIQMKQQRRHQKKEDKKQKKYDNQMSQKQQLINQESMIDQKEEKQNESIEPLKNFCLFIVPTEFQQLTLQTQQNDSFQLYEDQQKFIIKNMPQLKISPWISVLIQNCLLFLTKQNQVHYINYCDIKQLGIPASQWVCMGYKFELLQRNQVYQQRQSQFQDSIDKEQTIITKEFLDDWSQSLLPKNAVLKKAINRIRGMDL